MNAGSLKQLLLRLRGGKISVEEALDELKALPFQDIGVACVDHHRSLRRGAPEIIYGEGKETAEILAIAENMVEKKENVLVTRLPPDKASRVLEKFPEADYNARAGTLTLICTPIAVSGKGTVLIVSAGTSDRPVAEEAAVTSAFLGNRVETLYDVGVSGLHRILGQWERVAAATVIVVVAGMEGALPSVVAGLVDKPVIAVPTSVGYGASFQGIAALLGMLNSCASGVTVVNIDNGFGAGYAASLINKV